MRSGLLTYVALGLFLLLAPVLLASMLFAPGLVDLLQSLGLGGLAGLAASMFNVVIALMLVLAAWSARGTYHVSEHVRDMLPWAITFLGVVIAIQVVALR